MKNILRKTFGLILCLSCMKMAMGQVAGQIASDGEKLAGVKVWIAGSQWGTLTDSVGSFVMEKVPAGTHTLHAQLSGYRILSQEIQAPTSNLSLEMHQDIFEIDGVVVTATRNESFSRMTPVIVSVINDRLFEATQSISLSEGLSFQPGLRMENNCQNCGFSQLRMNGLDGAYSQILIDGRPVFSALNGIYGLEQIPAAIVDRVEVVRGGGSALYGSNAIGGTVNIITKDPIENDLQIGLHHGWTGFEAPDRAVNANGTIVSKDNRTGLIVFGMGRKREAFDANGDDFTEVTKLHNLSLGMKAFHKPNAFKKLTAELYGTKEYRRGGNRLEFAPHEADIAEELKTQLGGGGLTWEQYAPDLNRKYSLYLSALNTRMDNYYGAGRDLNGYGQTTDFTWLAGGQYTQNMPKFPIGPAILTTGIEYKSDRMQDEKPGYGLSVDQRLELLGAYAQHEWSLHEKVKWVSGVRMDYNNLTTKWLANPRFSLLVNLFPNLTFRSGYAKGFRAPQVFTEDVHVELVAGEVQAIRLAENLQSERSNSWNASMVYALTRGKTQFSFTVEAFHTRIQNAFVLEEVEAGAIAILEKRNGPGATVQGFNFEAKYAPNAKLAIQAGFTLQQGFYDDIVIWSVDAQPGDYSDRILRSPNQYGNLMVTMNPLRKMNVSISGVYTGSMLAPHFAGYIDQDRLETTPSFFELNTKVSYDWDFKDKFGVRFSCGVQNIFNSFQSDFDLGIDRDASYVYGPGRPRTAYVGMNFHLE